MSDWRKYMDDLVKFSHSIKEKPHLTASVDPYVLIFKDRMYDHVFHLYFDSHTDSGSPWMHLIIGSERALLIDTGYGIGDLKGLVKLLTSKPVDVVNTHFHGDHSGGDGQFGKVYIHEYDLDAVKQSIRMENRFFPGEKFYKNEEIQTGTNTEFVGIREGHVFHLGDGEDIEVFHVPGHAPGGCMFLDKKTHQMFTGDAFLATPVLIIDWGRKLEHPECGTVKSLRDALVHFVPRLGEVQEIFTGHGRQYLDTSYLTDMIDCCNEVIAHPDRYETYDFIDDPRQKQIQCTGKAMIIYSPSTVG